MRDRGSIEQKCSKSELISLDGRSSFDDNTHVIERSKNGNPVSHTVQKPESARINLIAGPVR